MLLHVVRETDNGIVVRGAKYETAAAYANQAFVKPTIANWGESELSDYAVGFICDLGSPGLKFICRAGFAGRHSRRGLPAAEPGRRGRHAGDLRRRRGALGERAVLPAHPGGGLHPRHAAPLQRLRLHPARDPPGRPADRRGAAQRAADRPGAPAGGAGEAGRAGLLPRGHQRAPDVGDHDGRDVAGRPADAEPVAALHRARAGHERPAAGHAPGARAVRRPDLRHARRRHLPRPRGRAVAGEVLLRQRAVAGRGPPRACWRSAAT